MRVFQIFMRVFQKQNSEHRIQETEYRCGYRYLKFDTYERAKYVLYSRKKGQLVYKIPKDEGAIEKRVSN